MCTSNVLTTEFWRKGFVLLGLRVARAAHSASNGSAIRGFVRLLNAEGAGGLETTWPTWNGLRGGIVGKDGCAGAPGKMLGVKTPSGGDPSEWDRVCEGTVGGRRGGGCCGGWDAPTLAVRLPSHCSPRDIVVEFVNGPGLLTGDWKPLLLELIICKETQNESFNRPLHRTSTSITISAIARLRLDQPLVESIGTSNVTFVSSVKNGSSVDDSSERPWDNCWHMALTALERSVIGDDSGIGVTAQNKKKEKEKASR